MYRIVLICSFVWLALPIFSQTAEFTDLSRYEFTGVKTEDGKLFYTTYSAGQADGSNYNIAIHIFDTSLNRITHELIPVKYFHGVSEVIEHNGGLIFYLASGREGIMLYYDQTGKKQWQETLDVGKMSNNEVKLSSLGSRGFVLVQPSSEKRRDGFIATAFDNTNQPLWTYSDFPERGNIGFSSVQTAGDFVLITGGYNRGAFSSEFDQRFYLLSATDGSLKTQQFVAGTDDNGHAVDWMLNEDGSTFVVGYMYDKDQGYRMAAEKLFYASYSADGKENFKYNFDLKEDLETYLVTDRTRNMANLSGSPLVHFHKIEKTEAGYRILGELYQYQLKPAPPAGSGGTAGARDGTLYIMDYVVINIQENGRFQNIQRIGKPYKRIDAEGHLVTQAVRSGSYFNDFNLFGYRWMQEIEGEQSIISINWRNQKPYIGQSSMTAGYEDILKRNYLERDLPLKTSGQVSTFHFIKSGMQEPHETYQFNILPYKGENRYLSYEMDMGVLRMEVMDLEYDAPKPSNNNLAIHEISERDFNGVHEIEGRGYYTLYFSEKAEDNQNLFVYHRLDKQLQTTGRDVISVPATAQFVGTVSKENDEVLVFRDRNAKSWYFYLLDSFGKLVSSHLLALDESADQSPTGNLLLEKASDGFYLIQTFYDRTLMQNGFSVIRINPQMEVRWNIVVNIESKETMQLLATDAIAGKFAIIHAVHPGGQNKKFQTHLTVFDDASGNIMYTSEISDAEIAGLPESVSIMDNGNVVHSGMYFKGGIVKERNSAGKYLSVYDEQGSRVFFTATDWKSIEDKIKATIESDFLVSGKMKVLLQDVIPMNDGSYKVIGELYRKSLGTTTIGFLMGDNLDSRAFSIYDFIVFHYDQAGKLQSVYTIPKVSQNIELPASIAHQKGIALSMLMRRYGMFSYQKMALTDDQHHIVFTNTENRAKFVYSVPLEESDAYQIKKASADFTTEKAVESVGRLQAISERLDRLGESIDQAISGTDQVFKFGDRYQGKAIAFTDDVLVYLYDLETGILHLQLKAFDE